MVVEYLQIILLMAAFACFRCLRELGTCMMAHTECTTDGRLHGLPSDNPPRPPHQKAPKAERSSVSQPLLTLSLCATFPIIILSSNVLGIMGLGFPSNAKVVLWYKVLGVVLRCYSIRSNCNPVITEDAIKMQHVRLH